MVDSGNPGWDNVNFIWLACPWFLRANDKLRHISGTLIVKKCLFYVGYALLARIFSQKVGFLKI